MSKDQCRKKAEARMTIPVIRALSLAARGGRGGRAGGDRAALGAAGGRGAEVVAAGGAEAELFLSPFSPRVDEPENRWEGEQDRGEPEWEGERPRERCVAGRLEAVGHVVQSQLEPPSLPPWPGRL